MLNPIKTSVVIISIFILGLYLRTVYLSQGAITFSFDQARDAFIIRSISQGDIKIQGPSTTAPGLYHGVLYYYLMLPAYWLGNGDPYWAAVWLSLINAATIFIVYVFSQELFNNKKISILLALLFAVSFKQTQYSNWLSNVSIASLFVPLAYFGILSWSKGKKWGIWLTAFGLSMSIQSEIFLLYHVPIVFLLWMFGYVKANIKTVAGPVFLFLFGISTIIVSDIKFGFPSLRGFNNLFLRQDAAVVSRTFVDHLHIMINQFGQMFTQHLFPLNSGYAGIFGILLIVVALRKKAYLLVIYVLSFLVASPFGGTSTPFIDIGLGVGVILLLGYVFEWLIEKKHEWVMYAATAILVIINIFYVVKTNKNGQTIFAIQAVTIQKEKAVLDYIYETQSGKPFSFNTVTSPLYINVLWSYMFNWYGKDKYGYLPSWHGHDQIGQMGNNLQRPEKSVSDYYLIIEPNEINLERWIEPSIREEDGYSKFVSEKVIGDIRIQRRIKL